MRLLFRKVDQGHTLLLFILLQVVQGDPPRLQQGQEFSTEFVEFVNTW